jgi:AraC-like DNA-binding protein
LHWDSTTLCEKVTDRPVGRKDVSLHCVLQGELDVTQGDHHVTVRPGQVMIKAAGGHTIKRWHGACEMLIVFVTRDALSRLVPEGQVPRDDGAFDLAPLTVVDLSRMDTFARFVATVVADLVGNSPLFLDPDAAMHAERTLHMLLLKSFSSPADEGTAPNIMPFYMRRAESYIRANLHRKLQLQELAEVSGVSPRTIQYGFSFYRQSSPTRFLKELKLKNARERLLRPAAPVRIAELAASLGYQSMSQFSRDYRERFGESPRQTLSRDP